MRWIFWDIFWKALKCSLSEYPGWYRLLNCLIMLNVNVEKKKCLLYLFQFLVSILLIYNRIMFWLNMFIQHKLWAEEQRTFLAAKWFRRNDSMHTLFVPFQNKWVANFFSAFITNNPLMYKNFMFFKNGNCTIASMTLVTFVWSLLFMFF